MLPECVCATRAGCGYRAGLLQLTHVCVRGQPDAGPVLPLPGCFNMFLLLVRDGLVVLGSEDPALHKYMSCCRVCSYTLCDQCCPSLAGLIAAMK